MNAPVPRTGGRLLVLDPTDRLLLVHERLEDGTTQWLTPGGGVEAGEHPRQAAVREVFEEVGVLVELAPDATAALATRRTWSWDGVTYDQIDHFFVVRVPDDSVPGPQGLTAVERQTVLGHRWWTLVELRSTDATLLPADLAGVLEASLAPSPGPGSGAGSLGTS